MADLIREFNTNKITTKDIGQAVAEMMTTIGSDRKQFERRCYDNNFFDDGYHFRYLSKSTNKIVDLSEKSELIAPLRSIPKASRQIRGVANLLCSSDPTPVVYPKHIPLVQYPAVNGQENPEYQNALKAAKEIAKKEGYWVQNEYQEQDMIEKLAFMIILAAKHGISYMQVWPDAVEEKVRTQVYDFFDIFLFGHYTELEDSPIVVKASPTLIAKIKANELFDQEQLAKISPDNRRACSEIKEAYETAKYGKGGNPASSASLILKEAYIKEYLNRDNLQRISEQKDAGKILAGKKLGDMVIRQTFVAGDVWLRDKYLSLPSYPFVDFRFEPGALYQVPLINRFIPANKSLDIMVSRVERFANTMAVGTWLKRSGEQFNITNQAGGQVIEYEGQPPVQGQMAQMPSYVFDFIGLMSSIIEEQGVSTSTIGKIPSGVTAHAAIESLKESEYANLVIATRRLKGTIKKITEKMLDIADNHFVTPQTVYYLEKGEPTYFDIIGESALEARKELGIDTDPNVVPVSGKSRVEIDIQSGMGFTKEGQRQVAMDIGNFMRDLAKEGLVSPEAVKVVIQKIMETYQFGATQDVMEALENFEAMGNMDENQIDGMKTALLEVFKDLKAAGGGVPIDPEQAIDSTKIGVVEALKDTGGINKPQPAQEAKTPSESISFKDLPPEGKTQMAAQAGIQLTPEAIKLQEIEAQQAAQANKAKGGNNAVK
jgi:hypothetical protein